MECKHEEGNINSSQMNIIMSLQAKFCMLPGPLPIFSAQSNPFGPYKSFLVYNTKETHAYF